MAGQLKIATFNVENLFERAAVLNKDSNEEIERLMELINELRRILQKDIYSEADKKRIETLLKGDPQAQIPSLSEYIEIREDRGKLLTRQKKVRAAVKGRASWDGTIVYKPAKFSDAQRANTARVIKDVKADILCIIEVESRPILRDFARALLPGRYPYGFAIDGNDDRGIDIGLLSKHRIGEIRTHLFEKSGNEPLFSRDCLEVEVWLEGGQRVVMILNHLKSKSGDVNGSTTPRRRLQAARLAQIVGKYDLNEDWVVVAGDFNDTPDSAALRPLFDDENGVKHLHDVLDVKFGQATGKRWTYFYNGEFNQIDYLLVSEPLKMRLLDAGVERRGIHDLSAITSGPKAVLAGVDKEVQYEQVKSESDSASDHGAVWAQFRLD